jgi:putative copper resistance protein D
MLPDLLSATLRGLAFVAVLQAGGVALFLGIFGRSLVQSRQRIRRLAVTAAVASVLLLSAQYLLEAARMTGELSGILDAELQRFVLQSAAAKILALRLLGIALAGFSIARSGRGMAVAGVAGGLLIAISFMLTGHTASSAERWLLGPALVLHLLVVEFWFGALLPLGAVIRHESADGAAQIVERFSRIATLLVPFIFVAGLVMTAGLLPSVSALTTGYGLGLVGKASAFALLMLLAALNRWRLGPALAADDPAARSSFTTSVMTEFVIIAAVLMGTAILTTFWSPDSQAL